ncbi:MAG TPA: acyl carrier protein [Hyphomicrobiales bacterium]|nr:acyl carrier protein [Hyphomicrobiales bacterium]
MTETSPIQARVLELLAQKVAPGRQITLESSVIEDTGLDSVSVMDLVMELEDEFDISIPLDRIAEVRTVADLAGAVEALAKGGTLADLPAGAPNWEAG